MKRSFLVILIISLVLCFTLTLTCKKHEEDTILNDKTKLPEQNTDLTNVLVNGDTLRFVYKAGATKPTFQSGDIVVGQTGEGYLKKVVSTTISGDTLILLTEQAALTDALQKCSIDTALTLSPSSKKMEKIVTDTTFIEKDGKKYRILFRSESVFLQPSLDGKKFEFRFNNVGIDVRDEHLNMAVYLSFDTIILIKTFDVDLGLKIQQSEVTEFKTIANSAETLEFKGVTLGLEKSFSIDTSYKLTTFHLGKAVVMAGPVPIVFVFEFGLYLGFGVNLSIDISSQIANNVTISSFTSLGARYENETWQPVLEKTLTGTGDFNFSPVNISAELQGFLKGSFDTKIYGIAGPSLYGKLYEYNEVSYPPFDYELGIGIAAGLGFKVEILDWLLAEFSWTFAKYEYPLIHSNTPSNYPPNTPSVPTGPDSGAVGESYTFSSTATDPDGDAVEVRFAWGDGDTSDWTPVASAEKSASTHRTIPQTNITSSADQSLPTLGGFRSALKRIGTQISRPSHPRGEQNKSSVPGHKINRRFALLDNPLDGSQSHAWSSPGMYNVTAQAKDEHGAMSGWSDGCQFVAFAYPTITVTIQPGPNDGKDAYIENLQPDSNFGHDSILRATNYPPLDYFQEILIQFPLTAIQQNAIIDSAIVSVFGSATIYTNVPTAFDVTSDWQENTVTYSTAPGMGYYFMPIREDSGYETWYTIDITDIAREWLSGSRHNYGLYICEAYCDWAWYKSSEHPSVNLRPKLTVTYHNGGGGGNNPPNTPSTPTGPDSGQVGVSYNFTTSTTDPDGDNVSYQFDWGDGNLSNWSNFVSSGTSVTMSKSWSYANTYLVKARAKDINGAISDWSSGHQIIISGGSNNPPNTPSTPSGPSSGYVDISYSFSSSATDPDSDSVAIRFDWGIGDTSQWSSYVPSGQPITMEYSWSSPGTYYVKAQAKDINGAVSNWSFPQSIIITESGNGWIRTFGGIYNDWGLSVQQTSDGGYIIAGETETEPALVDRVYLIKTNTNGNQIWERTYFNGDIINCGYEVQKTLDGGYIIVGFTMFGTGFYDVFLIKTNASGDTNWTKTFGGAYDDYGYSVKQTSDSGYIIAGYTNSFGAGDFDVYLIKTDRNGNQQWYKTFGGASVDGSLSIHQASDGGYIIAGNTSSFGSGSYDVYLIKTDGNGNQQWYRTFGGTSNDYSNSVQLTSDGGYIIAGHTESFGAGGDDAYLIKTDDNGNQQWYKTFGGTNYEEGYSVQQTSDGGYILAGKTESFGTGDYDVYLIKTDENGNQQWYKTFGGQNRDAGRSVQQTADGGYIIVGYTRSFGAGEFDVYLIKTDANGNTMKTFSPIPKRNYPNPSRSSSPKLPSHLKNTGRIGGVVK